MLTTQNRKPLMDPSASPPGKELEDSMAGMAASSAVLIDATRKWGYPPVSLPRREYMERARQLWERLELPKLTPREPWFGYELGSWSAEDEEEAQLALRGEHYQTGERRMQQRSKAK